MRRAAICVVHCTSFVAARYRQRREARCPPRAETPQEAAGEDGPERQGGYEASERGLPCQRTSFLPSVRAGITVPAPNEPCGHRLPVYESRRGSASVSTFVPVSGSERLTMWRGACNGVRPLMGAPRLTRQPALSGDALWQHLDKVSKLGSKQNFSM